ncbi:hypothetical protein BH23VER1_BH23VER1_15550 [soil metagenome]
MSDDFQELQRLLRLKQYERPPEGYFDEFLQEFQSRQRRELLHRSAHGIFFERVGTYFSGFRQGGRTGWIYGGMGAYAALMVGMMLWSSEPEGSGGGDGVASLAGQDHQNPAGESIWDGDVSISPLGFDEAPFSPGWPMNPGSREDTGFPARHLRTTPQGGILPVSDEGFREF